MQTNNTDTEVKGKHGGLSCELCLKLPLLIDGIVGLVVVFMCTELFILPRDNFYDPSLKATREMHCMGTETQEKFFSLFKKEMSLIRY